MLSNINYKGFTTAPLDGLVFRNRPTQCVLRYQEYTIILFPSGKCRIMGCKQPINPSSLPLNITIQSIQSITVTCDFGEPINLNLLARNSPSMYEPEIFPALRLTYYDPLCVNVFHTGKIVITGLKDLNYITFVSCVLDNILLSTCVL